MGLVFHDLCRGSREDEPAALEEMKAASVIICPRLPEKISDLTPTLQKSNFYAALGHILYSDSKERWNRSARASLASSVRFRVPVPEKVLWEMTGVTICQELSIQENHALRSCS